MNKVDADTKKISGNPSKLFFIEMLTRDINLSDCILDLVDNSIDSFIRSENFDVSGLIHSRKKKSPSRTYCIDISITKFKVGISDNCGGISNEHARNEVFRFGTTNTKTKQAGLSVYGIGMKRAFLKMGKHIEIKSSTVSDWFDMIIDVDKWKSQREDDWSFRFRNNGTKKTHSEKTGTNIEITNLYPDIRSSIGDATFATSLESKLTATYGLYIASGIQIRLNGHNIKFKLPEIAMAADLIPAQRTVRFGEVEIQIYAGLSHAKDRKPHGWYVFCNGRMMAEADQTKVTGWGDTLPQFNPKYNHFVGYVNFQSKNVYALPWTTTKNALVEESPVYKKAKMEMAIVSRPITSHLDSWYSNSEAKEEKASERAIHTQATAVPLTELRQKAAQFSLRAKKPKQIDQVSISYRRPKKHIDQIRNHLETPDMTAREVGEHTFDYFLKMQAEE